MSTTSPNGSQADLVLEGWSFLKTQRPLAAWASWQRMLRAEPDSTAAAHALAALESASDLPLSARTVYRFREATSPAKLAIWNDRMRDRSDSDLVAIADVFGRLVLADPSDSAAWYNRGLCLAWMGKNLEAIGCMERVVNLEAEHAFDQALGAWTLAEILRQGAGAEELADDLRFACTMDWMPADTSWLLAEFPEIKRVPTPRAPGVPAEELPQIDVYEWLDEPASPADQPGRPSERSRTILASVYVSGRMLRLSSPRAENLERIEHTLFPRLESGVEAVRREASPLPLPFLDADVWIFRIPPAVDAARAEQLRREAVEDYFENLWIHRPRHGLDGRSPLAAALAAGQGDAVARAKLTAVVRLREQLGNRPSAVELYQGYPFDRLRRRLGLELVDPDSVDPQDLSCATGAELEALDPATLDEARLAEAFTSAAGLRNDTRTARFAAELLTRRPAALAALDLTAVVSPLVRLAVSRNDYKIALSWLKEARSISTGQTATTLEIWRAEVFVRAGRPDSAMVVYDQIIRHDAAGAGLALDAGETMLDAGFFEHARTLLIKAAELARLHGRDWILRRSRELLDRIP